MGARKVVTIVFADLVGSTALHERLDAAIARLDERYAKFLPAGPARAGGDASRASTSCARSAEREA